ncbi:sensor histidine kinase [Azospirillum halopraeferens]|uniref:sensor histidine kinase n=1 Tax=Azospirillum halopraeferens TaxID=34010 RepID=UPI00146FBB3B|nr:ATP-binding protein [Azospirillum halopraeferens]
MTIGDHIAGGPARLALQVVGLLIALLAGALVLFVLYDRHHTLDLATTRTEAAVRLLEEHARRTFAAVDTVLRQVAERIHTNGPEATLVEQGGQFLHRTAAHLPEEGVVVIFDAAGMSILSTMDQPQPAFNVADRDFFRALKAGAPEPYVGRIVRGRASGTLLFTVARRLDDDAGRFAGVIAAGIRTDYFTRLYDLIGTGDDAFYGIFRDDGGIVVRQPVSPDDAGADIVGSPLLAAVAAAAEGTQRVRMPPDGAEWLVSFRRPGHDGVFVAVGLPVDAALAPWRVRAAWLSAVTMAAILVAALLGRLLLAELRRRENTMAEMDTLRRQAVAANLAKSRFLAAASHDLRQPLQALRLFLGIIDNTLEKDSHRRIAAHSARALETSERLLNDLLDVTRLDAGAVRPDRRDVPLTALLAPLAAEAAARAEAKGLDFRFRSLDEVVYSDPALLERMVRNLIVNAVRYTEHGRILLACRRRGNGIRIEVWDTGPGIAADKLDLIWEEFQQAHGEPAGQRGMGLGLSIVRRLGIILDHATEVRTCPGRGSVFTITVRRGRRDPARQSPPAG